MRDDLKPRNRETGANWVRRVLRSPSDRDKQRKIGPSDMGNMCDYCLADALTRTAPTLIGTYWLGARIGTAVHLDLEQQAEHIPGVEPESKVIVGELDGYGTVKGTSDGYWTEQARILDYKTTTRDKLVWIKRAHETEETEYDVNLLTEARRKVMSYIVQTHVYAKAKIDAGHPVKDISIVYLCRDGKVDSDIWSFEMDYQPGIAEAAWDRVESIWKDTQSGRGLDTFDSDDYCYSCTRAGRV